LNWLVRQFELSRGDGGHNVRPMEGLRGFAVFLVFLVHYVTLINHWLVPSSGIRLFADALHTVGNTGVDLFFVLSGYLIYGSLIARPQPFIGYMARRVQRIYPAFLAVFTIYVGLSFAFPAENKIPDSIVAGLLYLVANLLLLPGLFPIEPMITVAWSLSYEMFYYLAIPLVIVLFDLRARTPKWRVVFFAVVGSVTLAYCAAFGGHVRLIMFLGGIVLHEVLQHDAVPATPAAVASAFLVAGLLTTLIPIAGPAANAAKVSFVCVAFAALCHSCFRSPANALARAFSWSPLRWLGNMSYSYYLIHGLTLKAAFMVLKAAAPELDRGAAFFWALLPLMFATTLLPSAALFMAIERPMSIKPGPRRSTQPENAIMSK
jgi:exopolysaccharide production protein ExoZ